MRWLAAALLGIVVAPWAAAQTYGSYNGQCAKGGQAVVTQGLISSGTQPLPSGTTVLGTGVIGSYPSCTVAVYLTGTLTLATIYSNSTGTVLTQPFTANTDGSFIFYALPALYDVTISGGGLPSPVTLTAVTVNVIGGGGGSMVYPPAGIPLSVGGVSWGSSYAAQGTDSKLLTSGAVSGATNPLCVDSNGGATTVGCASSGLTSVGLSTTAGWMTVGSSPLVANGTITFNPTTGLTANQFLATPNGSTGAVALRSIVAADLPVINLASSSAGGVTGNLPVTNLNAGTGATSSTFWRGDGTWGTPLGTVTSVGLQINAGSSSGIFAVSGSPVTGSGSLNYNLTGTSGGWPYFSSSSILSSSGVMTAGNFVLGGGAGSAPTATFSIIPPANGGTGVGSPTAHTIPTAEGASNYTFLSPGSAGGCFMSNGTSADASFQTCPPGFANPMTTLGDSIVGGASGVATRAAGPASPNGVPQLWASTPSGGLATTQAWSIPGVLIDAQTGTSYTIPITDDAKFVTGNNGSATAWTGFALANNYVFSFENLGAGLITYTPASGTVNGNATQIIPQNWFGFQYNDNASTRMPLMPTIQAFPDCGGAGGSSGQHLNFTAATGALSCFTGSQVLRTTADVVITSTSLTVITGLSFTFAANVAINASIDCDLVYNQQTAAVADAFGFTDANGATYHTTQGSVQTAAGVYTDGNTTGTVSPINIVAFTPSAITTLWNAHLHLMIEQPSSGLSSLLSIQALTGNASDSITIKRDSKCVVNFQ